MCGGYYYDSKHREPWICCSIWKEWSYEGCTSYEKRDGMPYICDISNLQNICIEHKIGVPEYVEISSVGPPHNKEFTIECRISSITTVAKASTKKMAKQMGAKEMLERIKEILPDLVIEQKDLHKKLTEKESEAISKYQELREIIPDKSVKIDEISHTLAKIMYFKDLKYDEFAQDLCSPSEEMLKKILSKLELSYSLELFQESPCIVVLRIHTDTPLRVLSLGTTVEEASTKAINRMFAIMDTYMQIEI